MLFKSLSKKLFTGFCAVLLMATAVSAGDSTEARDGHAGGMPPMGPPAEMKMVAGMVGTWKADFQMRMSQEAPWTSSPSTLVITPVLGGAANRGEFSTSVMGMKFKGISMISFNRNTGKWQSTWIDNMEALQYISEGDLKDGKLVFDGTSTYMGEDYLTRETTTMKSATEIDWTMENSHDNGKSWYVSMKGVYTKQ